MTSRFAKDTSVAPGGNGRCSARIDPGWWIERGPNGGYLAAILLRAMTTEVDDPERRPRTLTVQYLRAPEAGRVELGTTVERTGKQLTTVSARMYQGQRLLALASASCGLDRPGPTVDRHPPPDVPGPDGCPPPPPPQFSIPMRERYEIRHAIGPLPFSGGDEAVTGGWIRLAEPEPTDHHVLAAVCDAWVPAVFGVLSEHVGVPTVDFTIHFRHVPVDPRGWLLVRFRTTLMAEGYLEEDGEVWDAEGRLLAQSRQLAAVFA